MSGSRPPQSAGTGDEEVAPGIADEVLDMPLLVGAADQAEVRLEEIMALQSDELAVSLPPRPPVILATAILVLS